MITIERYQSPPGAGRVIVHNGIAQFPSLSASNCSADIRGQTRDILSRFDRFLGQLGCDRSRLLNAIVWLRHIEDAKAVGTVWESWIGPAYHLPPATVEGQCQADCALVEIQVTVACPGTPYRRN